MTAGQFKKENGGGSQFFSYFIYTEPDKNIYDYWKTIFVVFYLSNKVDDEDTSRQIVEAMLLHCVFTDCIQADRKVFQTCFLKGSFDVSLNIRHRNCVIFLCVFFFSLPVRNVVCTLICMYRRLVQVWAIRVWTLM